MTKSIVVLIVLLLLAWLGPVWSQCPEDPNDRGICDTMYVEPWPEDIAMQGSPPYFVRVPIYVTCDVLNDLDSIKGFVIPLCYTTDTPSAYCSLSGYWNTISMLWLAPDFNRSIFRHMEGTTDTSRNRMAEMAEDFSGREWDTVVLNLDGTSHFWLNMVPFGTADQSWWEGSKVLLATMTFKVEEHMVICMDTCLWPPSSRLAWGTRQDDGTGCTKIPRSGTGTEVYGGCFNTAEVREVQNSENTRPAGFSLSQNYPNPFNPTTNFRFSLARSAHVRVDIFNILGQRVMTVVNEKMRPGVYLVDWDGKDEKGNLVSSGIYFYRMKAEDFVETKRMVLLK